MSKNFLLKGLALWDANASVSDHEIYDIMYRYVTGHYPNMKTAPSKLTALKRRIKTERFADTQPPARLTQLGLNPDRGQPSQFIADGLALYDKFKDSPDELVNALRDHVMNTYDKTQTQINQMSFLKREIRKAHPAADLSKVFLTQAVYQIGKDQQHDRAKVRAEQVQTINNADDVFSSVLDGITSDNVNEIYPAILLATGRRLNEINRSATFREYKDDEYTVRFTGQLKTSAVKSYDIPLMLPASVINDALTRLRSIIASYPQYKTSSRVSAYVRQAFGQKLSAKDLRAIYAVAMYDTRPTKYKRWNKQRYISSILGHVDMATTAHYDIYHLNGLTKTRYGVVPKALVYNNTSRGETKVVDNINKLRAAGDPVTVNALRRMGSSPAVIKRVFAQNPELTA